MRSCKSTIFVLALTMARKANEYSVVPSGTTVADSCCYISFDA